MAVFVVGKELAPVRIDVDSAAGVDVDVDHGSDGTAFDFAGIGIDDALLEPQ